MHNRGLMRRPLLLAAVLALPTVGSAQTAGTMTFTNTDADPVARTINIAECRSASTTVEISWDPTIAQPTGTTVTYRLYASNKDMGSKTVFPVLTDANLNTTCPTEADSKPADGTTVVAVGTELTNPTRTKVPFPTAQIAAALETTTVADPCAGTGTTTIYLCMQGKSAGTNFGVSRATITLSRSTPDRRPELLLPIAPGNTALTPRWADSASNSVHYQVQAISLADPTQVPTAAAFDPNGTFAGFDPLDRQRHSSGFVTGREVRVAGLRNGVTYAVMVTSYTEDYNPGDPSNIGTGAPEPTTNFWDTYKTAGGPENGGCSSGLAGPVGLLAVAGALALVRRRK